MKDRDTREPSYTDHPLDMGQTIHWYLTVSDKILDGLAETDRSGFVIPLENPRHLSIDKSQIRYLIGLFPPSAIARSGLRSIKGEPTIYFDKASTPGEPKPTENVSEALSPTAFAPSYTDYQKDPRSSGIESVIHLFEIPAEVDPKVRRIIHAQGFVHEYAHSIITPALYGKDYRLKLTSGEVVEAEELLQRFAGEQEKHTPFSHYSSGYRSSGQKFEDTARPKISVNEELAEAIAAELLGFVYCREEARRFNQFYDRPDVRQTVRDFLSAEKV